MQFKNWYLHFVLTVIAVCLVITMIQNQLLLLHSQKEASKEKQNDNHQLPAPYQRVNTSNSQKFAWVPVNEDGSIDVRIKTVMETMDVNIVKIDGYNNPIERGILTVKIKE